MQRKATCAQQLSRAKRGINRSKAEAKRGGASFSLSLAVDGDEDSGVPPESAGDVLAAFCEGFGKKTSTATRSCTSLVPP